jgi:hypothetical protein
MHVVFVHKIRGKTKFDIFPAVVRQAVSAGYQVTIIGNELARQPDANLIDIESLSSEVEAFRNAYRHHSVNSLDYERFCFERWFLFYAARKKSIGPNAIMIDSDVLVYPGLEEAFRAITRNGDLICNSPYSWFGNDDSLSFLCAHFLKIFDSDESAMEAVRPLTNVSDMNVLLSLSRKNKDRFVDLIRTGTSHGIDSNILSTWGGATNFECIYGYRKFNGFNNGRPVFKALSGNLIEFSSIHFQGRSKFFLEYFLTCHRDGLPDLTEWFAINENKKHPMYENAYSYLEWLKVNYPFERPEN